MKTDQDLIFEAYNKTLNEGSHLYGDTELGAGKYEDNEDINVADDYPDHEQILSNIREIVDENIGHGEGHEHSRETLDDIIDDLVQYRNGLPSTDDYIKGGKL